MIEMLRQLPSNLLQQRLALGALLLLGAATWLCARVIFQPIDPAVTLSPHGTASSVAVAPMLDEARTLMDAGEILRAIAERPVFSSSRRPFVPPPPEASIAEEVPPQVEEPVPEPQLTLQGVFMQGAVRRALILVSGNATVEWRSEGDDIAGWRLEEIRPNELVIRAGNQERILKLYVEKF